MKKLVSLLMALSILVGCAMPALATDSVEYSTKGGSWDKVSDDTYTMDKDGDGTSDVILTQDGNTWNYDFAVGDDTAPYYGWEDGIPEGYDVEGRGTAANPVYSGIDGEVGGTVYSHTPNFNDDGTYGLETYSGGQNKVEVLTVPGAKHLYVDIQYDLYDYAVVDYVCLWDGAVDFDTVDDSRVLNSVSGKLTGNDRAGFVIDGDTVSIGFVTNERPSSRDYGYYAKVTSFEYVSDDVKTVHTSNIGDDGVQFGAYGDNLNDKKVVSVQGADKLLVEYVVGFDNNEGDGFCIWAGDHSDYSCVTSADVDLAVVAESETNEVKDFCIVDGDCCTIGFESDDFGNTGYGYYVTVRGLFFDDTHDVVSKGTVAIDGDCSIVGGYPNNARDVDVVTIPGASKLSVELTYQVCDNDRLYVFSGAVSDVDALKSELADVVMGNINESVISERVDFLDSFSSCSVKTKKYVIDGDSVTFAFVSDDQLNYGIGYYARVSSVRDSVGGEVFYSSNIMLGDDGRVPFGYGDNRDFADVVRCDGADLLLVDLTVGLSHENDGADSFAVWAGSHCDYRVDVDFETALLYRSSYYGFGYENYRFVVKGDAVTFGLKSNDKLNAYLGYAARVSPVRVFGDPVTFDLNNENVSITVPGATTLCVDMVYEEQWHWTGDPMFAYFLYEGTEILDSSLAVYNGYANNYNFSLNDAGWNGYGTPTQGMCVLNGDSVAIESGTVSNGTVYGIEYIGDVVYSSSVSDAVYDDLGFASVGYGFSDNTTVFDVVHFDGADAIQVDLTWDFPDKSKLGIWHGDKSGITLDSGCFGDADYLEQHDYDLDRTSSFDSIVFDGDTISIGFLGQKSSGCCVGYKAVCTPVYYDDTVLSGTSNVDLENVFEFNGYSELSTNEIVSVPGVVGFYVYGLKSYGMRLYFFEGDHPDYTQNTKNPYLSYIGTWSFTKFSFFIPGDVFTVAVGGNTSDYNNPRVFGYGLHAVPIYAVSDSQVCKSDNLLNDGSWPGEADTYESNSASFGSSVDAVLVDMKWQITDMASVRVRNTDGITWFHSMNFPRYTRKEPTHDTFVVRSSGVRVEYVSIDSQYAFSPKHKETLHNEYGYNVVTRPIRLGTSVWSGSENVDEYGGSHDWAGRDVIMSDDIVISGAIGLKVTLMRLDTASYADRAKVNKFSVHEGLNSDGWSELSYTSVNSNRVYYVKGDSVRIEFLSFMPLCPPGSKGGGFLGYYATVEPIYGTGQKSVSHSSNLDDDGVLLGSGLFSYAPNMDWSEAVCFDGADALRVKVSYDTKSDAYVCIWGGADGSLKPSSDWMTSSTGKLSGSNKTADWIFRTDSITLGFRSVSAGSTESGYHIQVIPLRKINGIYVAHSPNVDNDGNKLESYSPNTDVTSVVSVSGADFMVAKTKYGMNSPNSYLATGFGAYPDYHAYDDVGKFDYINRGKSGTTALTSYNKFVEGDSITYGFHTDGTSVPSGNGGYGYYVNVEPYEHMDCGPRFYHSVNVDDDNVFVSGYGNDRRDVDTVTFAGSSQLLVNVKYQFADWDDSLSIYDRALTVDEFVDGSVRQLTYVSGKNMSSKTFLIDSDTVSFGFHSNASGSNAYGYYVEVYPVWEPGSVDGKSDMVITNKKRETTFAKGNIMFTKQVEDGTVTRVSHMSNLDDDGNALSNTYRNNESFTDVVTVPGASKLSVDITYQTESTSYDWACVWAGNHPDYTASSDYGSSVSGKLGGSTKNTVHYDIEGDSVTFGFRSDNSGNGYYGYYAVVTCEGAEGPSKYGFDVTLGTELDGLEKYIVGKQEFGDVTFYDGKAFVYAVPGEPVSIKGIPEGVEWAITERPAEGTESTYWKLGDTEIEGNTVSGVVVGDVTANAVCVNTLKADDNVAQRLDLTVGKAGDAPVDEPFKFVLKLWGLEPEHDYTLSVAGNDAIVSSDSLGIALTDFELSTGQSMVVHGLPVGCSYDVSEDANRCVAKYSIEGGSGAGFQSDENFEADTVLSTGKRATAEGDAPVVTFTNTVPVEATPETVDISVRKTWRGTGDKPDSIGFDLFEGEDLIGSGTLDEESGWATTFHSLPKFRADGTTPCEYSVKEATVPGFEATVNKVSDVEFEIVNSHEDTGNLSISKTVDGYEDIIHDVRDTKFTFDVAAYLSDGAAVDGEYVSSGSVEGIVAFEDGHASVQLGHGESITINGLPAGAHCIVTELDDENFAVVGGAVREGDIIVDGELDFSYVNKLSEVGEALMPETGGSGIQYHIIGGLLMIALGLSFLFKKRKSVRPFILALVLVCSLGFGMDAYAAEPVIVETFNIALESGATLKDGRYVWTPDEPAKNHKFVYRLDYSLSGMFSSEPGALKFELPVHIFKNRKGQWADTFECAYRHYSNVGKDDSPDFVYKQEGDKMVVYNYSPYETGTSGYIEFAYVLSEPTFEYVDMSSSIPVAGRLVATNLGETVTADASGGPITIDTSAQLKYVTKYKPKLYESWMSEWGAKPEDADQWLYLVWPVCSSMGKATQPYDLNLEDVFSDMGGSVVGYRFGDNGVFYADGILPNSRHYGSVWAYVLTRHSKAEAEAALSSASKYSVTNVVRGTVTPCDKVDAASRKQDTQTWVYEAPKYEIPTGHFWAEKWGIYNSTSRVKSSEDISNFYLAEFQSGAISDLEHLRFETYVDGYPYPWTLGPGADGTINDALNGLYGQKEVTYSLTDDEFTMGDFNYNGYRIYLADSDYDIVRFSFYPLMLSARFDPDTLAFVQQPAHWGSYDKSDNPVFEFRIGQDKWVKGFEFDMNTFHFLDMNEDYVTGYGGTEAMLAKGVKGIRVTCSNAYYYTNVEINPIIDIHRTDRVLKYFGEDSIGSIIPVTNQARAKVTQDGETLFERDVYGTDYVKKATRTSEIQKKVTATVNDNINRLVHVTWRSSMRESVVDVSGKGSVYQKSGIFYELMPKGATLWTDTIHVYADGRQLSKAQYDLEFIPNYKDSGRLMMKVDVKAGTDDSYVVSYTTGHTWNSIKDYGKRLLSSVAYESGNMSLAGGSKDNGGKLEDRVIMADVSENDKDVFLYADARHTLDVLTAGSTGLMKQVGTNDGSGFTYESSVDLGDLYTYRVRYENDATTTSRDILFFDSLENFYQRETDTSPTMPSDWKGMLQSVDVSQLRSRGIKPVVYLSAKENLNPYVHHDPADGDVWVEYGKFVEEYGLDAARAICVDARKGLNGSDFVLGKGNSLSFDLAFKAPEKANSINDRAYNNVFASMSIVRETSEGLVSKFFHQDYTSLSLRVTGDVAFNKVDAMDVNSGIGGAEFLLRGTSDYGNAVNLTAMSDMDGNVVFDDVELGTYELVETNCGPDWQLSHETREVAIDLSGRCTISDTESNRDGVPCVTNEARVHGDVVFYKSDSVSGRLINGATFRLAGTSDYGNEVMETATSVLGCVSFGNIEMGSYKMTEVTPADGYIPTKAVWNVRVDQTGFVEFPDGLSVNDLGRPVIENEKYHSVRFVKTSTYGENVYLGGAEFALSGTSDYGHEVTLTATSSDAADGGLVVFTGLEPGTYVLKETKAPEDHGLNEQEYVVNVHSDDSYEIIGLNKISFGAGEVYEMKDPKTKGTIRVTKKWDDDLLNVDRPIPDMTISTKRLVKDAVNYAVRFNANGGTFPDGGKELTATYMRNGKFVSGEITEPYVEDAEYATFKGWYTQETGGKQVMLSADGDLDTYVADGLTLYARYVFGPRYAVSVWGIGRDVDADGNAMGITFGPALRIDTSGSYKRHAPDGATASGNDHRCIHRDTWDTIIEWNKKDPYVYEQCVANNCSKAIEVDTGAIGGSLEPTLSAGYGSDGGNVLAVPGTAYSASSVACDWGKSQLRAMLNGPDSLTSSNNRGSYSDTANLYNCFPEAVRDAMGRVAVRYDPAGGGNIEENTLVSYDFLWLPSVNDMCSAVLDGQGKVSTDNHPYEGTAYGKFGDVKGMKPGGKTTKWFCVNAGGSESSFPMRSLSGTGTKHMYYSANGLQMGSLTAKQSYVAPCFSLKR